MLKTSFVVTRALFRVLCSGVSISMFGLCVKFMETMLQLVVLVVAVTVGPGCEATGMIRCTHHLVFACLENFVYFYCLFGLFHSGWYS